MGIKENAFAYIDAHRSEMLKSILMRTAVRC